MILSVNQVHVSYGKDKVLKGISFEMKEPKIAALVGPNGSGKSTLLNVITNLLSADRGDITILGQNNQNPNIFKEISYMQDNSVLYDYLTGYDHLQFIGDMQKLPGKEITSAAKRVGMETYLNKKVGKYSLGMKQHLLLTMAILNKPKLLILDEPLNGLDPTSALRVRGLLLELFHEGTSIILSSHNLAEIDRVTSHILFLKNGNLIKEDMSHYEDIYYQITVDNIEKAHNVLNEENIPVDVIEKKIRFFSKHVSLQKVFRILEQHQITLLDIEKIISGSENRYQKIFLENGEKQ